MITKQTGGVLDAGPAGASMVFESNLLILRSSAITPALVAFAPAACSACTKSRADDHPNTVNRSAFAFGCVFLSHVLKRPTSLLPESSPRYIALGRKR